MSDGPALFGVDLFGDVVRRPSRGALADRFEMPPFSVLSARDGYWQDRKRAWVSLGIQSELGRDSMALKSPNSGPTIDTTAGETWEGGRDAWQNSGTSIFDPVLCELHYRWFSGGGARILDPFAGGSVRGIVASALGRRYTGIDLRPEQTAANRDQATAICNDPCPEWIDGDAVAVLPSLTQQYDYLFTCPPYGDLEVYSDDPRDLSTMTWGNFALGYADIIEKARSRLRPHSFATFVVSNFRAPDGLYRDLVGLTIAACNRAGMGLYNEAVYVTSVGSLPVRVGRQFEVGRKLGRTHQNILTFVYGEWREAARRCTAHPATGSALQSVARDLPPTEGLPQIDLL